MKAKTEPPKPLNQMSTDHYLLEACEHFLANIESERKREFYKELIFERAIEPIYGILAYNFINEKIN